jgi:type I restriction enzyme S subunit
MEMALSFKGKLPSRILETPCPGSKRYLLMEGLRGGAHVYTEDTHLPSVAADDSVLIADGSKSGFAVRGVAGVLGSTLLGFRAREGTHPSFLFHLLSSLFPFLNAATTGTAVPHLDQDLLCRLPLSVPRDPDEQTAIARILDAVDTALERTRSAVERAKELDHALLHKLLARGVKPRRSEEQKYPSHWLMKRVDEVAEVGSGVTLGKDVSGFKSVELPYLRVANVQDGHLDLSTIKTVRVRADEVGSYRLETGDVLMTEGGDLDKLGRGTIWEGQIENCLHQNHIFRIRADRTLLEPEFFSLVVESDIAKRYFNRVAKRTTNLASTNKTQVRAFQFPLPPTTAEQREIVAIMKASKGTLAGLSAKMAALHELKKSLMHDLLTGRVRVKSPEEAIAS